MIQLAAVALGGALGAVVRHLISVQMKAQFGDAFPWGTLTVNLSGCFLMGMLFPLLNRAAIPDSIRLFMLTGLLGALTTFSTYGLESVRLIQKGSVDTALYNILLNNAAGILLIFAGVALGQILLNR